MNTRNGCIAVSAALCAILFAHNIAIAQVVINEVLAKPGPSGLSAQDQSMKYCSQPTDGREWVELYNTSPCDTADISCFILGSKTTAGNEGAFAFASGTSIPPLGFLVVGGALSGSADIVINDSCGTGSVCGADRWYLENINGWVALYDSTGNVADAVFWTSDSGDSTYLSTESEYDYSPCTPVACAGAGVLKKANQMTQGVEISYAGEVSSFPSLDRPLYRNPDGGSWNDQGNTPTPGACNGTCATPSIVSIDSITVTDATCGASDGTVAANVSGGTTPYSYLWNDPAAQTNGSATGLAAGTYTVIVTDSAGCQTTDSAEVLQSNAPSASVVLVTDVDCSGNSTGSIDLNVTGGTPSYTYVWDNGAGTSEDPAGLDAGAYNVTVTDANNCTDTASAVIAEPPPLAISMSGSDVTCPGDSNGTTTASVTGGTSPYAYQWAPPPASGQTGAVATGLTAGAYTVTVTDSNGCTIANGDTISEPAPLFLSIADSSATCGNNDGSACVTSVSGGTPGYAFAWSNGSTDSCATGLGAGSYVVTATDAQGCTDTASVNILAPGGANIDSVAITVIACNGDSSGSITVYASGGNTPYTFIWSNSATTEDIAGLAAGTYTVTVTDANNCTDTASAVIAEPPPLAISMSGSDVTCPGDSNGTTTTSVTGGTSPYAYQWAPPPATGQTGAAATGLTAGAYTVTVTDSNGCTIANGDTISEPEPLFLSIADSSATCGNNDGSACVTSVSGGTPGYAFAWSNGSTDSCATGLGAGSYVVTATDAQGCTDTASVVIAEPPPLAISMSGSDVTCPGDSNGTTTASVTGGTSPYAYQWAPPPATGQTGAAATGLTAGAYTVTVTDSNGCEGTDSVQLSVSGGLLTSGITATHETNINANDGSADLSVSGGALPYTYSWIGPGAFSSTSEDLSNLAPGTYIVTISDNAGCTVEDTVVIIPSEIEEHYYIPNIFTPGRETNNVLYVRGNGIGEFRFVIYDRWGEMVFESDDLNRGWDGTYNGKPVNSGVFSYLIMGIYEGGGELNGKGTVSLVR